MADDRLTLRLSPDARETLEWIASRRGSVSFVEVIRRALGTERCIMEQQLVGARILVEPKGGHVKELILM
jgi:hypothetical protein